MWVQNNIQERVLIITIYRRMWNKSWSSKHGCVQTIIDPSTQTQLYDVFAGMFVVHSHEFVFWSFTIRTSLDLTSCRKFVDTALVSCSLTTPNLSHSMLISCVILLHWCHYRTSKLQSVGSFIYSQANVLNKNNQLAECVDYMYIWWAGLHGPSSWTITHQFGALQHGDFTSLGLASPWFAYRFIFTLYFFIATHIAQVAHPVLFKRATKTWTIWVALEKCSFTTHSSERQ